MTELEDQLRASVTRLEERKGDPWRPWEHCQRPCDWHGRCRAVDRHGNGAECYWLTHQPPLSRIGRLIWIHARKLARGEQPAMQPINDQVREMDAPP
jgi:hypothetical protein